jgi:hypothetical protein
MEVDKALYSISLGAQKQQYVAVPPVGVLGYVPLKGPPSGMETPQASALYTRLAPHPILPPQHPSPSSLPLYF